MDERVYLMKTNKSVTWQLKQSRNTRNKRINNILAPSAFQILLDDIEQQRGYSSSIKSILADCLLPIYNEPINVNNVNLNSPCRFLRVL